MKRAILYLFTFLSFPGITYAQDYQQALASKALLDCFSANANKLDDDISDAATIARALFVPCANERRSFSKALLIGRMNIDEQEKALPDMMQMRREGDSDLAIAVVLQNRSQRKAKNSVK